MACDYWEPQDPLLQPQLTANTLSDHKHAQIVIHSFLIPGICRRGNINQLAIYVMLADSSVAYLIKL